MPLRDSSETLLKQGWDSLESLKSDFRALVQDPEIGFQRISEDFRLVSSRIPEGHFGARSSSCAESTGFSSVSSCPNGHRGNDFQEFGRPKVLVSAVFSEL